MSWWRGMKNRFFEAGGCRICAGRARPILQTQPDASARCPMIRPKCTADGRTHRCRGLFVCALRRTAYITGSLLIKLGAGAHVHFARGWRKTTHPTYPQQARGYIQIYGLKSLSPLLVILVKTAFLILTFLIILLCIRHRFRL